jgi:hypothetical protein
MLVMASMFGYNGPMVPAWLSICGMVGIVSAVIVGIVLWRGGRQD